MGGFGGDRLTNKPSEEKLQSSAAGEANCLDVTANTSSGKISTQRRFEPSYQCAGSRTHNGSWTWNAIWQRPLNVSCLSGCSHGPQTAGSRNLVQDQRNSARPAISIIIYPILEYTFPDDIIKGCFAVNAQVSAWSSRTLPS